MEEERRASGTIFTVFSTASAVGKTLVAVNMAAEMAREGFQVCVVDLDLQFGDVSNSLQLQPEKTIFQAQQEIRQDPELFDVRSCLTLYTHEEASFFVLAAPKLLEEAYNISTETVQQILKKLQQEFDYIVVDTAAAFSELNLMAMDLSTLVTFIGIVDFIPTIKNMKIGYDTLTSIGYDQSRIRFVLNRSNAQTRLDHSDVEELLGASFYHVLSNDFTAAQHSLQTGQPLVWAAGKSGLIEELRELVARYTNRSGAAVQERGGSGWFKRIFK